MAEAGAARSEQLRREYLAQTGRIRWHELQRYYAAGRVIAVGPTLDLVAVAVQLGLDNTGAFQAWLDAGDVAAVSDARALAWHRHDSLLWAVVAPPWVLVQERAEQAAADLSE